MLTDHLSALGQSLWLDNITRDLLDDGTLARYIAELQVTGLTSNPTIFDQAIAGTSTYDQQIAELAAKGLDDEALFTELALTDLRRAADQFLPVFKASKGVDGWVSMEVSPLLATDTDGTIAAALAIHQQADRPNLYIKIPGTPEGVPAIEESIFQGVPVNVTLLFSTKQYLAAASAWARGVQRRLDAGLDPNVSSVASLFISRWDKAVQAQVPLKLHNQLGIAVGQQAHAAYRSLLASDRWQALAAAGVAPQRLLWASTGSKDPAAAATLYATALAAADTVNTLPEQTLLACAESAESPKALPSTGPHTGTADLLDTFSAAGVDLKRLALTLQDDGAEAFVGSWRSLLARIAEKRHRLGN